MIVAIEGVDQAGKHTQSVMLQRALKRRGVSAKLFHFPRYDTPIGRAISSHLAAKRRRGIPPQVFHCLQAANKWEFLRVIEGALQDHDVVIMDRYHSSNVIYGAANGVDRRWLEGLERGMPEAALTILLDIPVMVSFARRPAGRDKLERDKGFLRSVRSEYLSMARRRRWKVVGADRPKGDVHAEVLGYLLPRLEAAPAKRKKAAPASTRRPGTAGAPRKGSGGGRRRGRA
ncbi:MAG: dTMP kinase [Thaumarchaeota archaeon]|nr:dTMP kinase [Nitrososphaerota archaeon]MDE0527044.1 dTMP kinase [Nitrososphaerota archaeon]